MMNVQRAKRKWLAVCTLALLTLPVASGLADRGAPNLREGIWSKTEPSRWADTGDEHFGRYLVVAQSEGRMPPLLGKTIEKATERLRQRGFTGNIKIHTTSANENCPENYSKFLKGVVCDTNPKSRETAPLGTDIVLLVQGERSLDDPFGVPPKVVGMSVEGALKTLHDHHFSVGASQNPMQIRFSTDPRCKDKVDRGLVCALLAREGYWAPEGDDWQSSAQMGSTPVVPSRDRSPLTFVLTSAREQDGSAKEKTAKIEMVQLVGYTVEEALHKLDLAGFRGIVSRKQRQGCNGGTWKTWESTPHPQEILSGEICWQSAAAGKTVRADRPIYYQIKVRE